MIRLLIFFNLILTCTFLHAQKEWVNWNSAHGGISFKSGTGVEFKGVPKNLQFPDYTGQRSVSYSDPATGNILFLTDGTDVWNKSYRSILYSQGEKLISCDSDNYKVQIVPFSNDPNKFYFFHLYSAGGIVSAQQSGVAEGCADPGLTGLYYSVMEMNFPAGTGKLLSKNQQLIKTPLDRVMLVKHANKKDTWVIGHAWDSSHFSAFLVTDTMIHPPVNTIIGPGAFQPSDKIRGCVAVSPDGKTLAVSGNTSFAEVYDFNDQTGELSNYRTINIGKEDILSLCFSPDNSKLYIATIDSRSCDNRSKIYQANFDERNLQKSLFLVKEYSPRKLELALGKDNHIWIKGVFYPGYQGNYYDLILYPNQPRNACIIKERHMLASPQAYFPNIVNGFIQQQKEKPATKMNLPDTITACLGMYTINATPGYESYRWNTGDSTASIMVKEPGMYTVVAGKKGFTSIQAYGYVYIKNSGGEIFISQDTFYCPKQFHLLIIPQHINNIKWSDGDTSRIKQVKNPGEYKLSALNTSNGCRVWDSLCVTIHNDPTVNFGNDTTLCDRKQILLKLKTYTDSSESNTKTSTFLWQDGSTQNTLSVRKPGMYWGQIDYNGCVVSDTIDVKFIPMPVINLGRDTVMCDGGIIDLKVPYLNSANYLWSNGSTDTAITIKSTGDYWLTATDRFCIESDTISLLVKPAPQIALGHDTTICAGTTITLNALAGAAGTNYTWNTGQTAPSIKVSKPGIYALNAELNGCSVSGAVNINMFSVPSVTLIDTFICDQMKLVLDPGVSMFDNVKWQDGSTNHTYSVHTPGTYSVLVTNKCGSDFATINVRSQLCEVVMPTAFTPNGDNVNDYFRIKHPEIIQSMNLVVFNRFGQQIFESKDAYKGWDGRFKGNLQTTGTYVWTLNYNNVQGASHHINGYVVLLR